MPQQDSDNSSLFQNAIAQDIYVGSTVYIMEKGTFQRGKVTALVPDVGVLVKVAWSAGHWTNAYPLSELFVKVD